MTSAPPPRIAIRAFRPDDAPALLDVFTSAIRLVACRDYTPAQIDAWARAHAHVAEFAAHVRDLDPFVAELDGHPVGYADLQDDGYIDHFFVSGHHPRRGIGRALMATVHARASQRGLRALTSHVSRTAQPFFAHHGFVVVGTLAPVLHGVEIPIADMRKSLDP